MMGGIGNQNTENDDSSNTNQNDNSSNDNSTNGMSNMEGMPNIGGMMGSNGNMMDIEVEVMQEINYKSLIQNKLNQCEKYLKSFGKQSTGNGGIVLY